MGIKNTLVFLVLAGCSTVNSEIDPTLAPVAEAVLTDARGKSENRLLKSGQPEPYNTIIQQNYDEFSFEFDNNLSELAILRTRARQGRLPSFTPSLSVDARNGLSANVSVRQVLFGGRVYQAEFENADAQVMSRQIALLDTLNTSTADDLQSYLNFHENSEREALLKDMARELQKLLDLARIRRDGGLVTADEVALFELNLTEIRTDILIAGSNAQIALGDLDGIDASAKPSNFAQNDNQLPLEILVALVNKEVARSELEFVEASAVPVVVLKASGGVDLTTGNPLARPGIAVEGDPVTFGGNTERQLAKQNLRVSEYQLTKTIEDVERETQRSRAQIQALEAQLLATNNLVSQANDRLEAFSNQFSAGSAGLSEAISLIDTLRRSTESHLSTRYEILNLKRELARDLGHFWAL